MSHTNPFQKGLQKSKYRIDKTVWINWIKIGKKICIITIIIFIFISSKNQSHVFDSIHKPYTLQFPYQQNLLYYFNFVPQIFYFANNSILNDFFCLFFVITVFFCFVLCFRWTSFAKVCSDIFLKGECKSAYFLYDVFIFYLIWFKPIF
jgi:hypothetical protein